MLNSRRMETLVAAAMLWFGTAGTALAQPVEINECGQVLADGGYCCW